MSSLLLPIAHVQQHNRGECLAACTAMVLAYLNVPIAYGRLLKLLRVRPGIGTPAHNVRTLKQLGLTVIYQQGTLEDLRHHLSHNRPCIALVQTAELPYWQETSDHAVVVSGIDDNHIYLNDPAFPNAPLQVPWGDFDLAWLEQDELYATFI